MNDYLKDLLSEIKEQVGSIVQEYRDIARYEFDETDPVYKNQEAVFEKLESVEAVFEYEEIKGELIEKVAFNLYSPEGEAEYHNVLQMIKNDEFDRADLEDMQADLNGFLEEHPDVLVSVDDLRDELISKVEEKIDELTNIAQESKDINVISAAVEDIKDLKTITEGFPYITIEGKREYETIEDIVDGDYLGKEDLQSLLDKLEEGEIVGIKEIVHPEYGFEGYRTFSKEPSYKEDGNDITNDGDDAATNNLLIEDINIDADMDEEKVAQDIENTSNDISDSVKDFESKEDESGADSKVDKDEDSDNHDCADDDETGDKVDKDDSDNRDFTDDDEE